MLAFAGVGTVLGAAMTARLRRSLGFGACWLGSYVLCGAAVVALGTTGQVEVAAASVLVYSVGMALAGICSMSLRQVVTPNHLLGRVTAVFWTLHSALGPIGAATLTALVGAYGPRIPLLAVGATFGLVVAVGLGTPIRRRDRRARAEPGRRRRRPGGPVGYRVKVNQLTLTKSEELPAKAR